MILFLYKDECLQHFHICMSTFKSNFKTKTLCVQKNNCDTSVEEYNLEKKKKKNLRGCCLRKF